MLSIGVARPWVGAHDWNGAAWSTAARNLNRFPFAETHLGVALHHGPPPILKEEFYVHHPPLVVWLLAVAHRHFGENEAVGRFVPLAFSLMSLGLLMVLLHRYAGRSAAIWGGLVFLLLPAQAYYGKMPNHEPLALTAMLAGGLAACRWSERPSIPRALLVAPAVIVGGLSGWPGYFFALALGVASITLGNPRRWSLLLVAGVAASLTLFALGCHIQLVRDDGLSNLLLALDKRSSAIDAAEWSQRVGAGLLRMIGPVGVGLLGWALFIAAFRRANDSLPAPLGRLVVAPLVFAGLMNVLLFREGAFVHEYYCFYLSAPTAVLAGLLLGATPTAIEVSSCQRSETTLARRASEDDVNSASLARRASTTVAHRGLPVVILIAVVAHGAQTLAALHQQQSLFYSPQPPETREFVRAIAKLLAERFPANETIVVDALPHSEALAYYADRKLIYLAALPTTEIDEWVRQPRGGALLNLDQPRAARLWAELQGRHASGPFVFADGIAIEGHRFGLMVRRVP